MAWAFTTTTASGTASRSGTTLTFSATPTGTVTIGMVITGTGVTDNTNIISGSGLVWTVSTSQTLASTAITCTAKTLTATGGSLASPNKLLAGIAIVQAADSLAGYTFADSGWLQNVAIVGATAWVAFDEDSSIEFLGSTYLKLTTNSGVIHDYKSTLILNVNLQRTSLVNLDTGTSFYSRCKTPYDPSPKIIYRNARYDYPSSAGSNIMTAWGIDGIDLIGESSNGSFPKTYAQTTTNPILNNIRYFGVNLYLSQAATTYTGLFYSNGYKAGEFYSNNVYENSSVIYVNSGSFTFGGDIRANIYKVKNPTFPIAAWSGAISFSSVATGYSFALSYTFASIILNGQTPISGMTVRYKPSYLSGSGTQPTYTILSATTNASGTFSQLELTDAYGVDFTGASQSGSATALTRLQWEAKARSYNYATSTDNIFSQRSLYQTATNMSAGYNEKALVLPVDNLTLTQGQAAALTGISLVASGTTGGVLTITSNHTIDEVWAYYRNWISTLANFNSVDSWNFDATTLNTSAWTIVGIEYLTTGKLITSTSSASGAFTSSITGNVSQATPTNLTGVSITGNLTFNTNTSITVTYTNCSISGIVSNSGTGIVTIRRVNTTIGTVSTNTISPLVTSLVLTGLTSAAAIYVSDSLGNQIDFVSSVNSGAQVVALTNDGAITGLTDGGAIVTLGTLGSGGTYTLDTTGGVNSPYTYKIAEYGKISSSALHYPISSSINTAISLSNDAYITVASSGVVAAYTTLDTPEKTYDYASLYETTNIGIKINKVANKLASSVSIGALNLIFNPSASAVWAISGTTLTIKTSNYIKGSLFVDGIYTSGNITINSGLTISSGITSDASITNNGTITGNIKASALTNNGSINNTTIIANQVYQPTNINLTGVNLTGSISYTSTTDSTNTFTNTTISGTLAAYSNLLTISLINSSVGVSGLSVVTRIFTQLILNGLTSGSSIYVANASGTQIAYEASSGTSYTLETSGYTGTWTWKVARYGYATLSGTHSPAVATTTQSISLSTDSFIVDTLANVSAYTDLNTCQKIYDYSSYYGTTNAGIIIGSVMSKGFGTLTIPSGLTLNPNAGSLFAVSSGIVTTKTSGLSESITILSSGNFTQGAATLLNNVAIRSANLNSELLFVASSVILYPTSSDRTTNSNSGPTSSTGIIRFLYGSIVSGVSMSSNLFLKVDAGIILFADAAVSTGYNILDYGTTGQLTILNAKVDAIPSDTWEYTERTINKALFV